MSGSRTGNDLLRRLSRFELKELVKALADKCGGEAVLQKAIVEVSQSNPLTLAKSTTDSNATSIRPREGEDVADYSQSKKMKLETTSQSSKPESTPNHSPATEQNLVEVAEEAKKPKKKKKKKDKGGSTFDMGFFSQRHIALHVAYFGENYGGLVTQASRDDTIEKYLFQALQKACLIVDPAQASYSRCGRTDAGVSALGQIVSLTVRSNLKHPLPVESCIPATKHRPSKANKKKETSPGKVEEEREETVETDAEEINYPMTLNKLLPDDICVLGWAPAPSLDFKARFNAEERTYRYYFAKRELNLDAMRTAAKYLEGPHDFRNFCKMDVTNVKNFVREITKADVVECQTVRSKHDTITLDGMCFFRITGTAFLWHQIRCIASVLFLVGRGLEEPQVVRDLLDLSRTPRKPVYDIAPPQPLILYESHYPDLDFYYDPQALNRVREKLEQRIAENAIRTEMARGVLDFVDNHARLNAQGLTLASSGKAVGIETDIPFGQPSHKHVSLLERKTCDSYDERVDNLSDKKRKVIKERHGWEL